MDEVVVWGLLGDKPLPKHEVECFVVIFVVVIHIFEFNLFVYDYRISHHFVSDLLFYLNQIFVFFVDVDLTLCKLNIVK